MTGTEQTRPADSALFGAASNAISFLIILAATVTPAAAWGVAEDNGAAPGEAVQINIDVRPGLCPNHLRLESALTVPIAVLGTVDFEVFRIDPASVRISRDEQDGEVAPVGWAYADVGTPLIGGLCACHKRRGDGLDDLEFSFRIGDLIEALALEGCAGETVPLILTGTLETGEVFRGADCAHVISGYWPVEESGDEIGLLVSVDEQPGTYEQPGAEGEPGRDDFKFTYFTTVTDRVTFMIYDISGRKVAKIHDMDMPPGIYNAIWDGTDSDSLDAAPGVYFARVSNSYASDTKKIMLP
jgi:hypothetical protein